MNTHKPDYIGTILLIGGGYLMAGFAALTNGPIEWLASAWFAGGAVVSFFDERMIHRLTQCSQDLAEALIDARTELAQRNDQKT